MFITKTPIFPTQLNLSLNLASNTDSSADQTGGPMAGEVGESPVSPILGASSPPPPPPHRSASIMTPTTTQFSPPQSPTPLRRQCALPHITGMSPPSSRARGVHNPLASGVPVPLTPSSPPSEESSSTMRGDTSDAASASTAATVAVPGLLPHMSRLLADWDNMSTDSCEEPWDVRHGKVISQLTSKCCLPHSPWSPVLWSFFKLGRDHFQDVKIKANNPLVRQLKMDFSFPAGVIASAVCSSISTSLATVVSWMWFEMISLSQLALFRNDSYFSMAYFTTNKTHLKM